MSGLSEVVLKNPPKITSFYQLLLYCCYNTALCRFKVSRKHFWGWALNVNDDCAVLLNGWGKSQTCFCIHMADPLEVLLYLSIVSTCAILLSSLDFTFSLSVTLLYPISITSKKQQHTHIPLIHLFCLRFNSLYFFFGVAIIGTASNSVNFSLRIIVNYN